MLGFQGPDEYKIVNQNTSKAPSLYNGSAEGNSPVSRLSFQRKIFRKG